MKVLVVVLYEVPDPDLKLLGHGNLSGIVSECQQLLLENRTFVVHASQNRGEVTNCEGIKANSENHPDHTENELCIRQNRDISIAHRGDGLKGPVEGCQIEVGIFPILDPSLTHPTFEIKVGEFS